MSINNRPISGCVLLNGQEESRDQIFLTNERDSLIDPPIANRRVGAILHRFTRGKTTPQENFPSKLGYVDRPIGLKASTYTYFGVRNPNPTSIF